jgi:hypothetical protein
VRRDHNPLPASVGGVDVDKIARRNLSAAGRLGKSPTARGNEGKTFIPQTLLREKVVSPSGFEPETY